MDSPSLPLVFGFLSFIPAEESCQKKKKKKKTICVSKGELPKRKDLFLKDFQTFGILSFEKYVEEMMLRVKVFILVTWIH